MNPATNPSLCGTSVLLTDAYKFPMAEAGAPLRHEVFYASHRKGGWQYVPLDIEAHIKSLLPRVDTEDYAYLDSHNYSLGAGARAAYAQTDKVEVRALPKGTWFCSREPIFSVAGPSALASWPEPLALQINFRTQVATCALLNPERLPEMVANATCDAEADIVRETLDAVGVACPPITVRQQDYYAAVRARAEALVAILGDPNRAFEVGLRAAHCPEQHLIVLSALRDAGILRTSNVYGAQQLGMTPVGTMGHEHVQRYGSSYAAFCAMRDRVPGFVSYLPDTYSTLFEGVPSALRAMEEEDDRDAAIRFDAEAYIREQYIASVAMARARNLNPRWFLESSWDDAKTLAFETLRELLGIPRERQGYGYGNFLVKPPWPHFGRDDVSAVYKLSQTGPFGRQKMGDEPGAAKESIAGDLVLWRPHLGMAGYDGPCGYVAQRGEDWRPPVPASLLTGCPEVPPAVRFSPRDIADIQRKHLAPLALSPETLRIREQCYRDRDVAIAASAKFHSPI